MLVKRPTEIPLKLAYLTDIHVRDDVSAEKCKTALNHALKHNPNLVVFGGDILDKVPRSGTVQDAEEKWNLFKAAVTTPLQDAKVPSFIVFGNHEMAPHPDDKDDAPCPGCPQPVGPSWGAVYEADRKLWFRPKIQEWNSRAVGLTVIPWGSPADGRLNFKIHPPVEPKWHVYIVDTVKPLNDGYLAHLSGADLELLRAELRTNKIPTLIFSHIPIWNGLDSEAEPAPPHKWTMAIEGGANVKSALAQSRLEPATNQAVLCGAFSGHNHRAEIVHFVDGNQYWISGGGVHEPRGAVLQPCFVIAELHAGGLPAFKAEFFSAVDGSPQTIAVTHM